MRVLFLAPNPKEAASSRYRILQYFPYLQSQGIETEFSSFLSTRQFEHFYSGGQLVKKAFGLAASFVRRCKDLLRIRDFDLVFVSREAMLFGPALIESLIDSACKRPMVFDFDDATFVNYVSPTYGRLGSWLKGAGKTSKIIRMSAAVTAGAPSLVEYAGRYNKAVSLLPTAVDLDCFRSASRCRRPREAPVIGWIGSHSTRQYLGVIVPALRKLAEDHEFIFKVIGAGASIRAPGVNLMNLPWKLESEIDDICSFDIGLYPLHDNPWTRGKCAFKAIQYMAAAVPCVASPVGMIPDLITDGVNGYLADSTESWVKALRTLLVSERKRGELELAGLKTVEKYSLEIQAPRLSSILKQAAGF